jgi:hypothetical protein
MNNRKNISLKAAGLFSSALLSTTALSPDTFRVPLELRPWIFVVSIFWFILVCSGVFTA